MDAEKTLEGHGGAAQQPIADDIALGDQPMTLRPRFAGDGRLRLPDQVSVLRASGDVVGEFGIRHHDPFGRTADGLLLAESFARFDFSRPRHAQQWLARHGVLDLAHLFPEDAAAAEATYEHRFRDPIAEVLTQQDNVRWHLLTLARLSAMREAAGPPPPGTTAPAGWDPAWAQPALQAADGDLVWLGGTSYVETHVRPAMRRYEGVEQARRDGAFGGMTVDPAERDETDEVWWAAARGTLERIQRQQVPILWVPRIGWDDDWRHYIPVGVELGPLSPVGPLAADWQGLVELERRLLEPYVRRAAERDVRVGHRDLALRATPSAATGSASVRLAPGSPRVYAELGGPIVVQERRIWRSLLAPVYLQLVEGLRRVTEGRTGAAWCRECGQPFLTLDARRSSFCTDRDRFRWSQRERRRRLAAQPTVTRRRSRA